MWSLGQDSCSMIGIWETWMWFVLQQQLTSYQTEKNRLSLTLEERTEQERAEQTKTLERLEQELVIREKAEAAAAEAERERSVLAVDLKDLQQKLERLNQEYNALQDKVRIVWKSTIKLDLQLWPCLLKIWRALSTR